MDALSPTVFLDRADSTLHLFLALFILAEVYRLRRRVEELGERVARLEGRLRS